MFLGRIITSSKAINVPSYIEVTSKFVDDGVPTLIIGKKRATELFGSEKIHVLDREITKNVTWTYAKNERRAEHEADLEKFKKEITSKLISGVKYYFLNIFLEKLSFKKKFIRWMASDRIKSVYITDRHIYVYGGKEVIGVSLSDMEYAGINTDKVILKIKSNPNNIIVDNGSSMDAIFDKTSPMREILVPYVHFLTK